MPWCWRQGPPPKGAQAWVSGAGVVGAISWGTCMSDWAAQGGSGRGWPTQAPPTQATTRTKFMGSSTPSAQHPGFDEGSGVNGARCPMAVSDMDDTETASEAAAFASLALVIGHPVIARLLIALHLEKCRVGHVSPNKYT